MDSEGPHEWDADADDWGGDDSETEPDPVGTIHIGRLEGLYVAEDEETGISSQGPTKAAALENLAANLDVYEEGESGGDDDWF